MREGFKRWNVDEWGKCLRRVFAGAVPRKCSWDTPDAIVVALAGIAHPDLNHVFLPASGGMDLTGSKLSGSEDQCIELELGHTHILRPSKLVFERPTDQLEWAYFWLEAHPLPPTDVGAQEDTDDPESMSARRRSETLEELTEVHPGRYGPRTYLEQGFYDVDGEEQRLPRTARLVTRYLKGSFVIFAKSSGYNTGSGPYDAQHVRMGATAFRQHIAGRILDSIKRQAIVAFPTR